MDNYLLTVAIPAYNRPLFLENSLRRILKNSSLSSHVQILVSDDSNKNNQVINKKNIDQLIRTFNFFIEYFINPKPGYRNNWLNCFNKSKGKFLLVLGDDDLLINNALEKIIQCIKKNGNVGLISYDACSYKQLDFDQDDKITNINIKVYNSTHGFFEHCGPRITHISSILLNKRLADKAFKKNVAHPSIIQMEYIFCAVQHSRNYAYIKHELVASYTEMNAWGCEGLRLFSYDLGIVMDNYINDNTKLISVIEKSFILRFYPIDIYRARKNYEDDSSYQKNIELLAQRYKNNKWFKFFLAYQIKAPKFLISLATPVFFLIGKVLGRDFRSILAILKMLFRKKS